MNFKGMTHSPKCEELAFPLYLLDGSRDSRHVSPRCSTGSSFILQLITTRALYNLFRGNSEHPVQACPDLFHTASRACQHQEFHY